MPFGLSSQTLEDLKRVLRSEPKIKRARIYGSRALGTYAEGSDIDICLNAPEFTLPELHRIETALDDLLLPYTFDVSVYERLDSEALKEHIDRVGVDV